MSTTTTYLAWITLAAAAIAVGGVIFFGLSIQTMQHKRLVEFQKLRSSSVLASQASILQSLVDDTRDGRSTLNTIATVDPTSLANTITQAGSSAGITFSITDAYAENGPSVNGVMPTSAFSFVASTQGSFASMMYATELLETLPVPSSIRQIQLIAAANNPVASPTKAAWQMNAQIRVLTASSTSL